MNYKRIVLPVIIAAILAAIDQVIKLIVVSNMYLYEDIPIIDGVLELTYIRNSGSAWGVFAGKTTFLLLMTLIVYVVAFYVYSNIIDVPRYRAMRICLILLIGGALGNMTDRIRLGYVVDYIYFSIIDFPVFNFADICVTIALFGMILLVIFKYNNDDFDVMIGDKKAQAVVKQGTDAEAKSTKDAETDQAAESTENMEADMSKESSGNTENDMPEEGAENVEAGATDNNGKENAEEPKNEESVGENKED